MAKGVTSYGMPGTREPYHTTVPMYVLWLIIRFYSFTVSLNDSAAHSSPNGLPANVGVLQHTAHPFQTTLSVLFMFPKGRARETGRTCSGARGGQLRELTAWEPGDVVWLGRRVGAGSLIILAGVLVHRATRPR